MATQKSTPLGIPEAEFIEDIKAVAPKPEDAEKLYREKTELMQKYRLLESHFLEKQQQLKKSRPGVVENLEAVCKLEKLSEKGDTKTHFQLSDSLYSSAIINGESVESLNFIISSLQIKPSLSTSKSQNLQKAT